tara:strand:+ start:510 stop:719 length:210 start_codon:yes stop_codon:yes gene_type:complete
MKTQVEKAIDRAALAACPVLCNVHTIDAGAKLQILRRVSIAGICERLGRDMPKAEVIAIVKTVSNQLKH